MIRLEDGSTTPQYDAMRLWSGRGSELLEAVSSDEIGARVSRRGTTTGV